MGVCEGLTRLLRGGGRSDGRCGGRGGRIVGRGLRCRGEGRQEFVIFYLFFEFPLSGGWNGLQRGCVMVCEDARGCLMV